MHELDFDDNGFEWMDIHGWEQSTISFLQKGSDARDIILTVFNFMPLVRFNYRVGVPRGGLWEDVLNSDAIEFGGSGHGNFGGAEAVLLLVWKILISFPCPASPRYSVLRNKENTE